MINQENLIKDNYYTSTIMQNGKFIWKCNENKQYIYSYRLCASGMNYSFSTIIAKHNWKHNTKNSTPEEIHWLNSCFKQNEFITFEEVMKTFIPEYVEAIQQSDGYTIGKIYKNLPDSTINNYISIDDKNRLNGWGSLNFKSSTKEAYDAQFVVKEPKFMLPENWHIVITNENTNIIQQWWNKWNNKNYPKNVFSINAHYGIYNKEFYSANTNFKVTTEITFEQFKKYVLKEQLEEPKDKVLDFKQNGTTGLKIVKVESSEGAIFELGDKINVFIKDSPNKGKSLTIKSFRWSKDNSKICAITEVHSVYGIGLDLIELYQESKEFMLPKKWCILQKSSKEVCEYHRKITKSNAYLNGHFKYLLFNTTNINIISPNNWIKSEHDPMSNEIPKGFTEITLDEFNKYVLNK